LDFIVNSVHMFDVRFRKASEANACERGDSAGVIYLVCICICVCLFPIKNWCQGQRFDPRGQLQHPILRNLQHVFRRSLSFPVTDRLHPFEWVPNFVVAPASERGKEAVSAELNVLAHEARVHPNQLHGQRVRDKLLLDLNRVRDDLHDPPLWQTVDHLGVQQAHKIAVHPLVAAYELVQEA
jgi:hypothetical protein